MLWQRGVAKHRSEHMLSCDRTLGGCEDSSCWSCEAAEPHPIRQLSLKGAPLASEVLTQTISRPESHHRRCLSPQWTIMELKGDRQRTSASVYALYLTYPVTVQNKSYIAAESRWQFLAPDISYHRPRAADVKWFRQGATLLEAIRSIPPPVHPAL